MSDKSGKPDQNWEQPDGSVHSEVYDNNAFWYSQTEPDRDYNGERG